MFFWKRDRARLLRHEFDWIYLNARMEQMALDITKLTADVAAQTTVISSAVALITGLNSAVSDLKTQLAAAIAANDPAALAAVQAALDDLDAKLTANTASLAAAVPTP